MHVLVFGRKDIMDLSKGADNSGVTRQKTIVDWVVDLYNYVSKNYGDDEIVGFYVHLDETNPPFHCALLLITPEKKAELQECIIIGYIYEYSHIFVFCENLYKTVLSCLSCSFIVCPILSLVVLGCLNLLSLSFLSCLSRYIKMRHFCNCLIIIRIIVFRWLFVFFSFAGKLHICKTVCNIVWLSY